MGVTTEFSLTVNMIFLLRSEDARPFVEQFASVKLSSVCGKLLHELRPEVVRDFLKRGNLIGPD